MKFTAIPIPKLMNTAELMAKRNGVVIPAYLLNHPDNPVQIVRGMMQTVFDEVGNSYLDGWSGVCTISVGHCHPDVMELWQAAGKELQHCTTLYLNRWMVAACEAIAETARSPDFDPRVFLVNSGTEATELAIQTARLATGKTHIIGIEGAFHGRTLSAMSLTAQPVWKTVQPYDPCVLHLPYCPNMYHKPAGMSDDDFVDLSFDILVRLCRTTAGEKNVAAFMFEPWQGNGGVVRIPPRFVRKVREYADKIGALWISDEVQSGVYRCGSNWWAWQDYGITPDMFTTAKGITNGVPGGALVAKASVAEAYRGRAHFNTYGGNPSSSAQMYGVVNVVNRPETKENIKKRGEELQIELLKLAIRHPLIGDVRGSGLMLGVELVRSRESKEPADKETLRILDICKEMHVLLGKGGLGNNVIRIKPPFCITKRDVDKILYVLDKALTEVEAA